MVDVDAATYSSRALGSGNAVVQWIAARHALACMRWLLPEQLARVGGDVVKWCLARPAKLARVLAQVCQLADSVTMCEMALRVGEVCGLWETKEWKGNRSRKTVWGSGSGSGFAAGVGAGLRRVAPTTSTRAAVPGYP